MNIFTQSADSVRDLIDRQKQRIKASRERVEQKDKAHEALVKDAEESRRLMADPRYPANVRLFAELKETLEGNLRFVLTGQSEGCRMSLFGKDYSWEEQVVKAGVIAGQIQLLKYIMEEPKKIVEMVEAKSKSPEDK